MERALLITVDFGSEGEWRPEDRAIELKELATSSGAKAVNSIIAKRKSPDSAYFIGSGKADEIGAVCAAEKINVVIFNNDLSGTQQKNLEDVIGKKIIDRTQLILDIFARHAHSNEGKLQVELAQLKYLLPRLTGKGTELSRLGGGIGTIGPGEQKLEIDRRRIRSRIFKLDEELKGLSKRRTMMRKNRERFSMLTIGIVGYTNVGKSTLLNALTSSDVIVQDKLFSTLDPTARRVIMPNKQKALLIDTVGFLNKLPHHLIEAFKATLEEVVQADILLHVVDASHPMIKEQTAAVYEVLDSLGIKGKPIITALNKIDKVEDPNVISRVKNYFDRPVCISALKKEGFSELVARITPYMKSLVADISLEIPISDMHTLNLIYESGLVKKKEYRQDKVFIEAEVPLRIKELLDKKGFS